MAQNRQHALASEKVNRLLWQLSLPAGIGMLVMAFYNIVDTLFIGRTVGPLGIAGLSVSFPVQMFMMSIGGLFGFGGASVISRALGAGKQDLAENTLGNLITSSVVAGIVATAVILSNTPFWLSLLGATDTVMPYAHDYLVVIVWGTILQIYAMAVNNAIRAEGNARAAMFSMIIGALANVGLDALFVLKLGMGVRGAAIATVIAQAGSCVFMTAYYLSGSSTLKIHLHYFKVRWSILKEVVAIGVSSFVRMVATSLVMALLNRTVVSLGGDINLAAIGIFGRVSSFTILPLIAVAQGLQPVLGFNYGAGRYGLGAEVTKTAIKIATAISAIGFAVTFFFSKQIIGLFSDDPALVAIGANGMKTVFLAWYLVGFQTVGSTVFQAIGKAKPAFLTAISRQVMFLLPLIILLPRFLGLQGVWLAFPIADGIAFAYTLALFIPEMRLFQEREAAREGKEYVGADSPE